MVMELIRTGHPEGARKLADGVKYIQIRSNFSHGLESCCFYLIRENGAAEDVSYRKCVVGLFPEMQELVAKQGDAPKRRWGRTEGQGSGWWPWKGGKGRWQGQRRWRSGQGPRIMSPQIVCLYVCLFWRNECWDGVWQNAC